MKCLLQLEVIFEPFKHVFLIKMTNTNNVRKTYVNSKTYLIISIIKACIREGYAFEKGIVMNRLQATKTSGGRRSMDHEKIVIDFGGQYNQLVARRVRECNVYCEIYSYKTDIAQIRAMNPKGIILTGGPNSCYEADSPTCSKELFELGVPVLGLCYGAQLMMHVLGGKVEKAPVREYGKTEVMVDTSRYLPAYQKIRSAG